jgi:hypothetical protein
MGFWFTTRYASLALLFVWFYLVNDNWQKIHALITCLMFNGMELIFTGYVDGISQLKPAQRKSSVVILQSWYQTAYTSVEMFLVNMFWCV